MPDYLTQLFAVVGSITGLCALRIQYLEIHRDKPILDVKIEYKRWSTSEHPEMHNHLGVILKNHGKQPIHILAVDLLLYPETVEISEQKYDVKEFKMHLYNGRKKGLLKIEPLERKEIITEPCDFLPDPKKNLAVVQVTDALDQTYKRKVS